VPPWAISTLPFTGPSAPLSLPKSSRSSDAGSMPPQATARNGPSFRGLAAWIARATARFPLPGSPVTSTAPALAAIRGRRSRSSAIAALDPSGPLASTRGPAAATFSTWFSRTMRACSIARSTATASSSGVNGLVT